MNKDGHIGVVSNNSIPINKMPILRRKNSLENSQITNPF